MLEVADVAFLPVASNVLPLFAVGEILGRVELVRQKRNGKLLPTMVANKGRAKLAL